MTRLPSIAESPVSDGVQRGIVRFEDEFPQFRDGRDAHEQASLLVTNALASHGDLSERGRMVLGELAAIAVCARMQFSEEPLTPELTAEFFTILEEFLNSWMHE